MGVGAVRLFSLNLPMGVGVGGGGGGGAGLLKFSTEIFHLKCITICFKF